MSVTKNILLFADKLNINLVIRHIPGHRNVLADALSRTKVSSAEWTLLQSVFDQIRERVWGPFEVDLFANNLNKNWFITCPLAQILKR